MRQYRNRYPAYSIPVRSPYIGPTPRHGPGVDQDIFDKQPFMTPAEQPLRAGESVGQNGQPRHQPQYNVPLKPTRQPSSIASASQVVETPPMSEQTATFTATSMEDQPNWEAIAKQQQVEMDNFRKRQTQRADEAIAAEKEHLLRLFLPVADNLERALQQASSEPDVLQQGIELIRRELIRLLEAEGVTRMEALGTSFDPNLHEAIAALPGQAEPDTIISEVERGYRLNGKLLRPAKVVVAR